MAYYDPRNPGYANFDGEDYVLDGDMWVPQWALDMYNGGEINTNDPDAIRELAKWKVPRATGITTAASQMHQEQQGGGYQDIQQEHDPGGWGSIMNYANSLGIRAQDNPMVSGLRYGHVRALGDGRFVNEGQAGAVILDKNGQEIGRMTLQESQAALATPAAIAANAELDRYREWSGGGGTVQVAPPPKPDLPTPGTPITIGAKKPPVKAPPVNPDQNDITSPSVVGSKPVEAKQSSNLSSFNKTSTLQSSIAPQRSTPKKQTYFNPIR